MLTVELEDLEENFKIVELSSSDFIIDETPKFKNGDEQLEIDNSALEEILRIGVVPTKFFERLLDSGEVKLSEDIINYCLKGQSLNAMVEENRIARVLPKGLLFIPNTLVNRAIHEYFQYDVDILNYHIDYEGGYMATYLDRNTFFHVGEKSYQVGVRVIFSNVFRSVPRFDGILYNADSDIVWSVQLPDRRFRVKGASLSKITAQVYEFISDTTKNLLGIFAGVELSKDEVDFNNLINVTSLKTALMGGLRERLLKKQAEEFIEQYKGPGDILYIMSEVNRISEYMGLDPIVLRDIQCILTKYALGVSI